MELYGYGRILDVDLTTGRVEKREFDKKFTEDFIGGMGMSTRILYDEVGPEIDPLSHKNILIFANGPFTGTEVPCSGRTEVTTKSSLTGHIGSGNTGGLWGARLKHAGFDLLIIRGRAERPSYLWINDDSIEIRDAIHLWGKDTNITTNMIIKELAQADTSDVSVLTIGPAGENLVKFACTLNDFHHVAGRCGAGAVMGSKMLKAIAVRGTGSVKIAKPDVFKEAVSEARQRLLAAERARRHPDSPKDVRVEDYEKGCLPGKNFQTGILSGWLETRTAEIAKQYVTGFESICYRCPVPCFNVVEVKEGKFSGTKITRGTMPGVVFNFGALCAIDNLPAIWRCKEICQNLGLDYESSGASIAFAMELFQRGIIDRAEADGLDLSWGNEDTIINLLKKIAFREGFGDVLADGTIKAAKKIGRGAERYAFTIKRLEIGMMPDPRPKTRRGWLFGFLTNPRGGDNLKNTHFYAENYNPHWWVDKFDIFEDVKEKLYDLPSDRISEFWDGKAMMCKWFEDLYSLCNALGICFFPVGFQLAWGPTYISKMYSSCTGRETNPEEMMKIGERIFTLLKIYTVREGFTRKDDSFPERFYTEPMSEGPAKGAILIKKEIESALDEYYELRGWDRESGLPTVKKLSDLGLADIAVDLKRLGMIKDG